jgi:leucyl/phenylalanyl-tRNA---protein transferase
MTMNAIPFLSPGDDFPDPENIYPHGIVAYGNDLSTETLIKAYSMGIFPWYDENSPITWHSPNPRFVLFPNEVNISRSMKKIIRKNEFQIKIDTDFAGVISQCSMPRAHEKGTWLTKEMIDSYIAFHKEGYAHSFETWQNDELVGGLYGVCLGKIFFGESMFAKESNASKAAFIYMARFFERLGFFLIDSQVYTSHVGSLGGFHITRKDYLTVLHKALEFPTMRGNWSGLTERSEFRDILVL